MSEYESLLKEINYAKTSVMPQCSLYEIHGKINMARHLNALTKTEFLNLEHECVAKGINNPKYFDR